MGVLHTDAQVHQCALMPATIRNKLLCITFLTIGCYLTGRKDRLDG
jgi:hypothetical protein